VEALADVAERGDERAITGLCAGLEDADRHVRKVAVRALAEVAEKGDERAITGVCARLEDADWDVRKAAVRPFAQLSEKLSVEATISAMENNTASAVCLKPCNLGLSLQRFASALQKNTCLMALDITNGQITREDAPYIVKALQANFTLTILIKDESSPLNAYNEQITPTRMRNKFGVQVLTLHLFQQDPDQLLTTSTNLAGHKVATVQLASIDTLLTLDAEIAKQSQHFGVRSFILADGSLIGCPLQLPEIKLSELQGWTGQPHQVQASMSSCGVMP